MLRTERRRARGAAEPIAGSVELHRVLVENVGRRRFVAVAALVGHDAVVAPKLREASLTAQLMMYSAHYHLVQWRCDFSTHRARSTSRAISDSLARFTTVCNGLLRTPRFPGRDNHTTVILDILSAVGTCCNQLLERVQATLRRTHVHTQFQNLPG